ncbi:MAG TPA: PAS domain S-box protein [Nitrospiraceae bacterium]|nr:PAS domain S-box protein [Nitrospiraceae bacterium]
MTWESPSGMEADASARVRPAPPCVLIVDDDPDIRQALGDMLKAEGYGIHAAATGSEAIAQTRHAFYGAVLLDIGLPDLDGHAVLRSMREVDPTLPVIVLTGYITEQNTIGPLTKGAIAYVTKPYRPAEIKAVVRRAIEMRALALKAESVEFALSESQERFRSVFQSSSDGIVLTDDQGTIVSWNESAERMFGYTEAEIVGKPVSRLLPGRYQTLFRDGLTRLQSGNDGVPNGPIELYGRRRDGMEIPVEVSASTWNAGGRMFFGAIVRDITARRRSEQRRAAQYAVTRVLAESATLVKAAPKLLQTICESLSWDIGLLWGVDERTDKLRCLDVWHTSELRPEAVRAFSWEHLFPRGSGLPGRVWANGDPLWVQDVQQEGNFPRAPFAVSLGLHGALAFPVKLHGHILGVLECFSRDIRQPDDDLLQMLGAIGSQLGQFIERTQAQAALDRTYAKMEATFSSMPCALIIVDSDLQISYANPTASRYFSSGSEGCSLTGWYLNDVFGAMASESRYIIEDTRAMANGIHAQQERSIEIRKRTYRYRPFPVIEGPQERTSVGIVLWDTTEQQQLQDQLIQAEKLASLGTLVSGMAHEVNNPIQGILSMAEILVKERDYEKIQEYAEDIVRYSQHVGVVVKDFACYARPASTDREAELDMNERLREALKLVQRSVQFGHVEVVTNFGGLPSVRGRRSEIDQVFVNLITNAVDAMQGRGRLTLLTEFINERLELQISDTGCGIPPSLISKIFDPFMTTKDPGKGTGLGLSIAYKIVSKYGGHINVKSEEGRGSTFTISFPVQGDRSNV